jgi:hypothetical protein
MKMLLCRAEWVVVEPEWREQAGGRLEEDRCNRWRGYQMADMAVSRYWNSEISVNGRRGVGVVQLCEGPGAA